MRISIIKALRVLPLTVMLISGFSYTPARGECPPEAPGTRSSAYETLGIETTAGTQFNRFGSYEEYKAAGTTASVRSNSIVEKTPVKDKTMFIIYGVDLNSDGFRKGDFIFAGDLAQSAHSDYDYDGLTLPITGAVVVWRKNAIDMLAPDAKHYIIDGVTATRADFDSIPSAHIQCVTIHGDTLLVKNKLYDDVDTNPDVQKASEDEGRLMRLFFTGSDAFAK